MPSRLDYARLLAELNERLADADGPAIREWLREQGTSDRVRHDAFVPGSLSALESPSLPALQSGDILTSPIAAKLERVVIPAHSQLESPVQVSGTLVLERDVHAAETLFAGEAIIWQGGPDSELQNLVAPNISIESPPGCVRGGVWCDRLAAGSTGTHLPAALEVLGAVIVDQPDGALVVGHGARLGGLVVKGAVRTEYGVAIGRLVAGGEALIGRGSRVGSVEAASVEAERECRLAAVASGGAAHLGRGCVVESLRAEGDITFESGVTVTGDVLLSRNGSLDIPEGDDWSSRREHWFYALPDQSVVPFRPDIPRPERSALVALRALTHSLWQQTNLVAGRTP